MRSCLSVVALALAAVLATAAPGADKTSAAPGSDLTVSQLLKEAHAAEKSGDIDRAYLFYAEAARKDPANLSLWAKAHNLLPAVNALHPQKQKSESFANLKMDPSLIGSISAADLAEVRRLRPPVELKFTRGPRDLNLRGDSKDLFEKLAGEFGLECIFDVDYKPQKTMHLELQDADPRDAIRALEAASGSFVVPINSHQFLVADDTPAKRTQFDPTEAITIPIPEAVSVQEVQELATAVRGALDIQKLMVDSALRLMLMRDRISKVRLAQKLVYDLMKPTASVGIEVQLLEIDDSFTRTWGFSLPNMIGLFWAGSGRSLTSTAPSGFSSYWGIGGGKSLIALGIANASLFANVTKSISKTLLQSEVVTNDGQAATLHVGDKYPIPSNSYLGPTTGTGTVYTPPPTFTFEDLGLVLKITPHVHGEDDMTLDVESEFKLLGSQSVDGIPVISNRKFQSKVRLLDNQWAILAGLMTKTESESFSGIPGLMFIPFLRQNTKMTDQGETLIVIKPRLLSLPASESITRAAWVGTETRPRSAL